MATLERVCRVLVIQNILTRCAPDIWLSAMSVCNPYRLVYLEISYLEMRNNTKG